MKTITLQLQVPDWAEWLAQDDQGTIWFYKHKPELEPNGEGWKPAESAKDYDYSDNMWLFGKDWQQTLTKI